MTVAAFARPETASNVRPRLTPRMERAIVLLVQGRSVGGVAKELGVAERTVTRWRANDVFEEAYSAAKDRSFRGALDDLRILGTFGVRTLGQLLSHSDARIRLHSARAIVSGMLSVAEMVDFAERLNALERRLAARDRP